MPPASRCRTRRSTLLLLSALVLVAGCGSRPPQPLGDPGGVAVEVSIDFTWQYLNTMSQWHPAPASTVVVIEPDPFWIDRPYGIHLRSGCVRGSGFGYGYRGGFGGPVLGYYEFGYPDPYYQDVNLLAGDGPAESELFHLRLRPGHRNYRVFIRPGRQVTLSVQAVGNREGWVVIGHFTSAFRDGGRLHIELDAEGSALQVFPPPEVQLGASVKHSQPLDSGPAPAAVEDPSFRSAVSAPAAAPATAPVVRTY